MPWPAIRKTANNDSISRPNSRPKLPFPGNGKGNYKMPWEGKGNLKLVFPGITGSGNSRSPLKSMCCLSTFSSISKNLHFLHFWNFEYFPSLSLSLGGNPCGFCPRLCQSSSLPRPSPRVTEYSDGYLVLQVCKMETYNAHFFSFCLWNLSLIFVVILKTH